MKDTQKTINTIDLYKAYISYKFHRWIYHINFITVSKIKKYTHLYYIYKNIYIYIFITYPQFSVYTSRCPVRGDHPSQAAWRWVSTRMGDRRSVACRSKRWARRNFFSDCRLGQTLRHRFSAVSLCLHANAIQHDRECLHILKEGISGRKEVKEKGKREERWKGGKRRKMGWGYAAIAMQVEPRIKNIYIYLYLSLYHIHSSNVCFHPGYTSYLLV